MHAWDKHYRDLLINKHIQSTIRLHELPLGHTWSSSNNCKWQKTGPQNINKYQFHKQSRRRKLTAERCQKNWTTLSLSNSATVPWFDHRRCDFSLSFHIPQAGRGGSIKARPPLLPRQLQLHTKQLENVINRQPGGARVPPVQDSSNNPSIRWARNATIHYTAPRASQPILAEQCGFQKSRQSANLCNDLRVYPLEL